MLSGARDFFSGFETEACAGFWGGAFAGFGAEAFAGASAGFGAEAFAGSASASAGFGDEAFAGFKAFFGVGGSSFTIAAGLFMPEARLTGVSWPHLFQHKPFGLRQVAFHGYGQVGISDCKWSCESMDFRLKSLKFRLQNCVLKP